jgi:hypothetical protein
MLSTFGTSTATNPASGACREVLLVTSAMAAKTTPAVTADYTMNPIPASYLAAGSLSFETAGGGATYWRVSWGGAAYTGPDTVVAGTGAVANDSNGHTAPPFPGPLPSSSAQALHFTPACSLTDPNTSLSTNSAADYAPTTGSATLKNNAAASFVVGLPIPTLPEAARFLLPVLLGFGVLAFAYKRRRRA